MRNYKLFLKRLGSYLKYPLVCFTFLATANSLFAKEHTALTNINVNVTLECNARFEISSYYNTRFEMLFEAGLDSGDVSTEDSVKSTSFYGIEFHFEGKWEKISDRDFPQGALLLNDGKFPDGSAFVSVIPENLLEDGPAEIMKMTPTGERSIDGRKVVIYETDVIEENVHDLFFVFEDLQHKGSNIVIMAFSPAKRWNDVSGDVNSLLDNAKIK